MRAKFHQFLILHPRIVAIFWQYTFCKQPGWQVLYRAVQTADKVDNYMAGIWMKPVLSVATGQAQHSLKLWLEKELPGVTTLQPE